MRTSLTNDPGIIVGPKGDAVAITASHPIPKGDNSKERRPSQLFSSNLLPPGYSSAYRYSSLTFQTLERTETLAW